MSFLFRNPFNRNENPSTKLNIISSTPVEVMKEIGAIEDPTIIKKINSTSIKGVRFDMGTIDTFHNSSGVFNSVGPLVVSWRQLKTIKNIRAQAFVGFGKEKSLELENSIIYVPVFEGYSSNTVDSYQITTHFHIKLLRESNGTLQILNGKLGDLREILASVSLSGVLAQSVFTFNINSEGRTPIWFIDGK